MTPWHAIILGIVEGITEYLPVSSTGHLILTSAILGLDHPPQLKKATDTFLIVIQGGAILAVVGLYWPRIVQMCRGLLGKDAEGRRLLINLIVAFLPAAVFGLLLEETIDRLLFHPIPVMIALFLGGVVMIAADPWQRRRFDPVSGRPHLDLVKMGWKVALIIGFVQCLAMWPGTSRSMVTILAGIAVGLRSRQAAEFAFLLGLPTLGGATAWKLLKDVTGDGPSMFETLGWAPILIGVVVAAVASALAIKWLVAWLTHHGLAIFGWYRIALTAVILVMVIAGSVSIGDAST